MEIIGNNWSNSDLYMNNFQQTFYPTTNIIRKNSSVYDAGSLKRRKCLDEAMSNKFRKFIDEEWDSNYMYTPSDFIEKFGITRHLSRYYLMDLVYERKLYRVKYANKTWYDKVDDSWQSRFKEYIWMGVEVTSKT